MSYYNPANTPTQLITWTWDENKVFECALVMYPEGFPHRWELISNLLPGKTVDNAKDHYATLISDLNMIESGLIELPIYREDLVKEMEPLDATPQNPTPKKARAKPPNPWIDEEQRLFLEGLARYGKGDWRSISRHVVRTRTPAQIASHAQKYFLHLQNLLCTKSRKRSSIHDITLSDPTVPIVPSVPSPPLTDYDFSILESSMPDAIIPDDSMLQEQHQGGYQNHNIPTSY